MKTETEKWREAWLTFLNENSGRDPMHDGNFRVNSTGFISQQIQIAEINLRKELIEKIDKKDSEEHNTEDVDYQSFVLGYQRAVDDIINIINSLNNNK